MEIISWTSGEKEEYKKSSKNDKPILNSDNEIIHNIIYRGEQINKKKEIENNYLTNKKKQELLDRSMIPQTYINPFLNKNYNDVLSDQEKFLIPKNSSISN